MPSPMSLNAFSHLLATLYRAATSTEYTKRNFLTELTQLLNLQNATLIVRPPSATDPGLIYSSSESGDVANIDSDVGAYTRLYTQDPLINIPLNKLTTIDDVLPRNQLLKSDYFQMVLEPFDVYYIAGMDWVYEKNSRISIRFGRQQSQGPFTPEEKQFLELLLPHLEQSVSLGLQLRQLDSERQIYADSISKRSIGIITLDKHANILQHNATAEKFINEGDGFKEYQNKIKLNTNNENDVFSQFINDAIENIHNEGRPQVNALSISRDSGKAAYQMIVKPMPVDFHNESDVTPYLTLLIQDPENNLEISVRTLMNLYQLTMSEATIAILLAEGHTTDEVAQELNIKKNTVRAHLRSMFVKLGVTQQSMLVSQVLTSLASTQ